MAGNLTALDTQVKANAEAVATKAEAADITVGTAGNYIAAGTNVASNLTALDTQVKANADAIQAGNEALTTKGIAFKGDTGTSGAVKLDGELAVKGDSNIATTASAGQLSLSLNKDVNLGSTGSMTVGKSVINDSGLVITDGTQVTSVTASGINAGSNRVTNVANGTDTNDAVNYGQLMTAYALGSGQLVGVGDGLSAANGEFSVNAGEGLTFGENGQLQVNAGDDLSVDADGKLQVNKGGEVASGNTGLVTGGTVYTALEGVKSATKTALAGKADKATTLSGYGITDAYTKADTDTLLNKKADQTALDAVKATADSNKAALESLGLNSSESTNGEDTGITLGVNTTKIAVGKGSVASGNEAISIGNAVGDQKNIASGSESIAIGFGNQVTGNHSGAFGDPNEVSGNASYAFGNDNTVSADKTFVLGNNVTASGTNSVVLGDGSDGSESNVVSVGADGNERRITHVAAGQNATDAATVGQVNSVAQSINNLDSRINKVGAGAAALAALHPTDQDGKFGVGVGYGNYHSANAVAMGLFYRPTDNMMMSLGGTVGNGENMVNVGLSIALDKPAPNSKQAMTKKIAVQEAQLAQQGEKLAAQDAELKAQKKEIEALKEALQRLEAKISG
ncbi:YadA-like family protein [uncultured Anaerovibrio sp.]|uniref:YadA-like family protein n=1 Tax=uncultured Anaerovibrio sp. TaxID=361586 RepID=UPI0025FE7376|nr:YadA-like family protein [uncultured Anaerovibrio sp.]